MMRRPVAPCKHFAWTDLTLLIVFAGAPITTLALYRYKTIRTSDTWSRRRGLLPDKPHTQSPRLCHLPLRIEHLRDSER